MNHCVEVVCISCGAYYCALGCSGGHYPKKTVQAAFAALETQDGHHYRNLKCKSCGYNTIYDATPIEIKMFTINPVTQ